MYRSTLSLVIILFSFSSFSQTFKETADWISNNAGSSGINQQVFYSESKQLIYFIKVLQYKNGEHTFISFVFDPKKASSISINKDTDVDGGHNLTLWFSESTMVYSVSIPDTPPFTGTRLSNDYVEKLEVQKGSVKRGTEIYLSSSMEQVKKVKKAYIHLFQILGYSVKDADNMF